MITERIAVSFTNVDTCPELAYGYERLRSRGLNDQRC